MNPGKIIDPPKMDDRDLFRFGSGYKSLNINTKFDWSEWGGFAEAIEMCNNNGACRKSAPEVMCPSFRVTKNEQDLTRGRANALRLAISGQLGPEALTSEEMAKTMSLCVGCKGCKRECPTGVDMAKMKTEFLYHYRKHHRLKLFDWLVSFLPRYAPSISRFSWVLNLFNQMPWLSHLRELLMGISAERRLPYWAAKPFSPNSSEGSYSNANGMEVLLFSDTFNTYFEPKNLVATVKVLNAAVTKFCLPMSAKISVLSAVGGLF